MEILAMGDYIERSASDSENSWLKAYNFVETEKKKITGYARHFLPYSSYSLSEFIQQAYESAYRAFEKCLKKEEQAKYRGYFWKQYLKDCYKMANIPSWKKFYEECIKSSIKDQCLSEEILKELSCSPIVYEEYREYSEDDAPATAVASSIPDPLETAIQNEEALDNELKELIQDEKIKKALALMTKKERQVWDYLLGHHDSRIYSITELIHIMGLRKSRIIALRDTALAFIQKIFSTHNHLYTLEELSEKTGYSISTLNAMKRYGFLKANEDYIQRTQNSKALFTEKAFNKLNARRERKIRDEILTTETTVKLKRQKLYTLEELSERTGYSISTLRSMRCYGFFEIGREVIKAIKSPGLPVGILPLSLGKIIACRASGESTEAKKITGTVYLFTEKAVKKLLNRRKRTKRTKEQTIKAIVERKPLFIKLENIDIDRPLPVATYEPIGGFTIQAHIIQAHMSPTPNISTGVPA